MFGFVILWVTLLIVSFVLACRARGFRTLYDRIKDQPIHILYFAVLTSIQGLVALKIYIKWLDTITGLLDAVHKWKTGLLTWIDFWEWISEPVQESVIPRWVFWSKTLGQLWNFRQCTEEELDELCIRFLLPAFGIIFTAGTIDCHNKWKITSQIPYYALRLSMRIRSLAIASFWSMVAAYRYVYGIHTTIALTSENTKLKSKLDTVEPALSAALLREAQFVLTIALFGKKLKANGEKILSLEETAQIMEVACETWYEESQGRKKGTRYTHGASHEHQMNLMQATVDQQACRMRSLAEECSLAHKMRYDSRGVKFENSKYQAAHEREVANKQAEIEELKESIQEKEARELGLQQALGMQQQTILHEQSLRHDVEEKLSNAIAAKKKSEDIAMELKFESWDHQPGKCVQVSRLRAQGRITNAQLVAMEADYEKKFDHLLDECSRLRSELKRASSKVATSENSAVSVMKIKQLEKVKDDLEAKLDEISKEYESELQKTSKIYEAKINKISTEFEAKVHEASKAKQSRVARQVKHFFGCWQDRPPRRQGYEAQSGLQHPLPAAPAMPRIIEESGCC